MSDDDFVSNYRQMVLDGIENSRKKREELRWKNKYAYWRLLVKDFFFYAKVEDFTECLVLLEEAERNRKNGGQILINTTDKYGWSAIFFLAQTDCVEYLDDFIWYGADIDGQDRDGETPLHAAAWSKSLNMLTELIDRGAIYRENYKGETPKDVASGKDVRRFLMEYVKKL